MDMCIELETRNRQNLNYRYGMWAMDSAGKQDVDDR